MDCKFFKWLFASDGRCATAAKKDIESMYSERRQIEAEKIFAEIDNDLINQIDKATRDFKQAQLKHIPCQILHYNKRIQRHRMERIKAFLIENKSFYIPERRYEDGSYRGGYYYRENTNFIKNKESK